MSFALISVVFVHTLDVIQFEHGHERCLALDILQVGRVAQLCCSHVCTMSLAVVDSVKGIEAFW